MSARVAVATIDQIVRQQEEITHLTKQRDELVKALEMMLSLVRNNAPELSGKVVGFADEVLASVKGGA